MKIFRCYVVPAVVPFIFYVYFLLVKLMGCEPLVDDIEGIHAFMGVIFLLFGFSISYLMVILGGYVRVQGFWWLSSMLFMMMAIDASIGIHEDISWTLSHHVGLNKWVSELVPYCVYMGILFVILCGWFRTFSVLFWKCLFGFFLLVGIAMIGDVFSGTGEGTFIYSGTEYSYEQILETGGFLLLAVGFCSECIIEILVGIGRSGLVDRRKYLSGLLESSNHIRR